MPTNRQTVLEAKKLYAAKRTDRASVEQPPIQNRISVGTFNRIRHGLPVGRDAENAFRQAMLLPPLPSLVTVEVPPGGKVRVIKPTNGNPKPKREKRYSVPTDPTKAAEYLMKKMSREDRAKLVTMLGVLLKDSKT